MVFAEEAAAAVAGEADESVEEPAVGAAEGAAEGAADASVGAAADVAGAPADGGAIRGSEAARRGPSAEADAAAPAAAAAALAPAAAGGTLLTRDAAVAAVAMRRIRPSISPCSSSEATCGMPGWASGAGGACAGDGWEPGACAVSVAPASFGRGASLGAASTSCRAARCALSLGAVRATSAPCTITDVPGSAADGCVPWRAPRAAPSTSERSVPKADVGRDAPLLSGSARCARSVSGPRVPRRLVGSIAGCGVGADVDVAPGRAVSVGDDASDAGVFGPRPPSRAVGDVSRARPTTCSRMRIVMRRSTARAASASESGSPWVVLLRPHRRRRLRAKVRAACSPSSSSSRRRPKLRPRPRRRRRGNGPGASPSSALSLSSRVRRWLERSAGGGARSRALRECDAPITSWS